MTYITLLLQGLTPQKSHIRCGLELVLGPFGVYLDAEAGLEGGYGGIAKSW